MQFFNLLSGVAIQLFERGADIHLDWIGNFINILINWVGNVGLGIVAFTLLLKLLTLPLDIYSRVKMRKNNLVMEDMRPQLEKLQKQYANDQQAYNQQVMQIYKKNGYSMIGACLPTLVTMIIFIVVISAFSSYSQFTNLSVYNKMTDEYNNAIQGYITVVDDENTVKTEDGDYNIYKSSKTDAYIYIVENKTTLTKDYYIDTFKLYSSGLLDEYLEDANKSTSNLDKETVDSNEAIQVACKKFFKTKGAEAAKNCYLETDNSFLWVKNIWYSDVSWTHPVKTYDEFKTTINKKLEEGGTLITSSAYEDITSLLDDEKGQANGYFVFIVLSILLMLGQQLITMKTQKAQTELQSSNTEQTACMQKSMTYILPIMFGVFAFMYSAAFCLYMVTSTAFSIITTLLTTKLTDLAFEKKSQQKIQDSYNRRLPNYKKGDKK